MSYPHYDAPRVHADWTWKRQEFPTATEMLRMPLDELDRIQKELAWWRGVDEKIREFNDNRPGVVFMTDPIADFRKFIIERQDDQS